MTEYDCLEGALATRVFSRPLGVQQILRFTLTYPSTLRDRSIFILKLSLGLKDEEWFEGFSVVRL
jgi:hypothetical protein